MFAGVTALLLPARIPKAQLAIMKLLIEARGGTVVSEHSPGLSHIITAHTTIGPILESIRLSSLPPNCIVVSPEFVAKSIQSGVLENTLCQRRLLPAPVVAKTESAPIIVLDSDEEDEISDAETIPLDESELLDSQQDNYSDSQCTPRYETQPQNEFWSSQQSTAGTKDVDDEQDLTEVDRKKIIIPEPLLRYMNTSVTAGATNKNKHITDEFERLVKRAEAEGNHWRIRAYKKAVKILAKLETRILSSEDAKGIPGIGPSMREKIAEILRTGYSLKAHTIPEKFGPLEIFKNIYGVGTKIAERFYALGYRTLADVKAKATLTKDQQLGIKYYNDFLERIPRSECTAIDQLVQKELKSLDPKLICQMMGSYVRGSESCGDVDFMITHPEPSGLHDGLLESVVQRLQDVNFVIDSLSSAASEEGHERIWRGVCRLNSDGLARRIDLLIVPYSELGAATIYFSSNQEFNRCIRLLARKKGYSLNQHGLYKKEANGVKTLVASRTEQEIFSILGVPWKPPTERNI
ncbi:hypothetical protein BDR26DRAFT_871829 [Obelidium mucronatum]|nr:hypothetical protein BDR26DRAFT_871829 [Obelidium mucronatum]